MCVKWLCNLYYSTEDNIFENTNIDIEKKKKKKKKKKIHVNTCRLQQIFINFINS